MVRFCIFLFTLSMSSLCHAFIPGTWDVHFESDGTVVIDAGPPSFHEYERPGNTRDAGNTQECNTVCDSGSAFASIIYVGLGLGSLDDVRLDDGLPVKSENGMLWYTTSYVYSGLWTANGGSAAEWPQVRFRIRTSSTLEGEYLCFNVGITSSENSPAATSFAGVPMQECGTFWTDGGGGITPTPPPVSCSVPSDVAIDLGTIQAGQNVENGIDITTTCTEDVSMMARLTGTGVEGEYATYTKDGTTTKAHIACAGVVSTSCSTQGASFVTQIVAKYVQGMNPSQTPGAFSHPYVLTWEYQ